MRKLVPLLLSLILLVSCSDFSSRGSAVYMVSVANRYSGQNTLSATLKDQSAMVSQVALLSEKAGNSYYEYTFTESGGELMLDGEGYSASGVLDFLSSLEAGEDDLVIFYYSGHGGEEDENGLGAVLYFDPVITNDQVYTDELIETLSAIGGKKLLILDCCYSGEAVTGNSLSRVLSFSTSGDYLIYSGESVLDSIKAAFTQGSGGNGDIWVMAACQAGQLSYEYGHGFFTYGVLSALGYDVKAESPDVPSSSKLTFTGVFSDAFEMTYERFSELYGESYARLQTPSATQTPVDLILFEL